MSIRPDDPRLADFTPEEVARGLPEIIANQEKPVAALPQYEALAYQAAGLSGDTATAEYIKALASGSLGGEADTTAAFGRLIEEGRLRNLETKTPVSPGDDNGDNISSTTPEGRNAFARLEDLLATVGLKQLAGKVQDLIARGIVDEDAIFFNLRDEPEYQERFKGNIQRVAKGLAALKPITYVALEQQYMKTMIANGLDASLYDQKSDFISLIGGDVSNAELQNRIDKGYRAIVDSDPEVVRQMSELYQVTPANLVHFFLDPTKTEAKLRRQADAANLAARAKEQGKIQLTALSAEDLVARGYTESQAEAAFRILSDSEGLYKEMSGETALTESQKIGSVFGFDEDASMAIQRRGISRKAVFEGGGGFSSTQGDTSGTTKTGLGEAD